MIVSKNILLRDNKKMLDVYNQHGIVNFYIDILIQAVNVN